jgi:hypothetical protein
MPRVGFEPTSAPDCRLTATACLAFVPAK